MKYVELLIQNIRILALQKKEARPRMTGHLNFGGEYRGCIRYIDHTAAFHTDHLQIANAAGQAQQPQRSALNPRQEYGLLVSIFNMCNPGRGYTFLLANWHN